MSYAFAAILLVLLLNGEWLHTCTCMEQLKVLRVIYVCTIYITGITVFEADSHVST